jgi:hypothetical protein
LLRADERPARTTCRFGTELVLAFLFVVGAAKALRPVRTTARSTDLFTPLGTRGLPDTAQRDVGRNFLLGVVLAVVSGPLPGLCLL